MASYQTFKGYEGSLAGQPRYEPDGIGYDYEVPDNLVVATPGGVSTVHHHWTGGFYGRGNSSADNYAGQGQRYNSGVYGNLYQTGQTAAEEMGYFPGNEDYKYWLNGPPQQYSQEQGVDSIWSPSMTAYASPSHILPYQRPNATAKANLPPFGEGSKKFTERSGGATEHFDRQSRSHSQAVIDGVDETLLDDSFELMGSAEDVSTDRREATERSEASEGPQGQQRPQRATAGSAGTSPNDQGETIDAKGGTIVELPAISPWVLFFLFLMAFITFDFWASAGHLFVKQHLHKGKRLTWQRALVYAILITALFALMAWMAGVPVTTFEKL